MANLKYLEKLIIRSIFEDQKFLVTLLPTVDKTIYANKTAGNIWEMVSDHFSKYRAMPTIDMVVNSVEDDDIKKDVVKYIKEASETEFDITTQYDYLIDNTDEWLKQRSIQIAIMDSADEVSGKEAPDYGKIRQLIEAALVKSLKFDMGLNYFGDLGPRLKRVTSLDTVRVTTGFPSLDELFNGGLPAYTLSVFPARVHTGKSNFMINMMARQVMKGHNPILFTLEMSQDSTAQRFDSIFSGLDINRIYTTKKSELITKLKEVKATEGRGTLFIKQYPPASSNVNDFRTYLHELSMRGHYPSIIYCDYINLMKPTYKDKISLYEDVKRITEELRALSFEYKVPVVSVTQINRTGMMTSFDEIDFEHTADSVGIIATADVVCVLGIDHDAQVYESEIHFKVLKNRIGGQVGHTGKFFIDDRTLKMWDDLELDAWMESLKDSGGSCEVATKREDKKQHGNKASGGKSRGNNRNQ